MSHPLSPAAIRGALPAALQNIFIETHAVVGSTNDLALAFSREFPQKAALFAADSQTAGRGRRGRSFYSPAETGLYMSVAVPKSAGNLSLATVAAAVAVREAFLSLYGIESAIKWVNDLFVNGRKVCGILSEGVTDENGLQAAVVGIGINLTTADFPEDIRGIAGSLGEEGADRNILAAAITERLFVLLGGEQNALIEAYAAGQLLLGKEVRYALKGEARSGVAIGIGANGELLVRRADGTEDTLFTGEVSLGSGQFAQ